MDLYLQIVNAVSVLLSIVFLSYALLLRCNHYHVTLLTILSLLCTQHIIFLLFLLLFWLALCQLDPQPTAI